MTEPSHEKKRFHWRKLFQFRLITILIIVAVIAAGFAWLRITANEAARQIQVVEELEKADPHVNYELKDADEIIQ